MYPHVRKVSGHFFNFLLNPHVTSDCCLVCDWLVLLSSVCLIHNFLKRQESDISIGALCLYICLTNTISTKMLESFQRKIKYEG